MPASTIVASGGALRLYGDAVQTYTDLPLGTYTISFSPMDGYSLHLTDPLASGDETVYGNHASRVARIETGYTAMDRSLGVILSGDKGMGKSLMIRMLAQCMRELHRLPTILVQHSTPGLASFLDELGEAVVVFDEFEKVFDHEGEHEAQNQFLSLFDGLSATKRLYVLSVNELHRVNEYMLNRPGRFHYHMRFAYPEPDTVATYLRDQAPGTSPSQVEAVVDFSRRYDLNFDHLRAIAFELRLGHEFAEVIADLNIKRTERAGSDVEVRITWQDDTVQAVTGTVDLFDHDSLQTIQDWGAETKMRFRLRDAEPTPEGYVLRGGAFDVIDTTDDTVKADGQSRPEAVTAVLRRPRKHSIDF